MKLLRLLAILALVFPFARAQAANDADALLLKADSISGVPGGTLIASGNASVASKHGVRFTAGQITYSAAQGTLTLSGDIQIHLANGNVVPARELVLEVKDKRLFTLSSSAGTLHLSDPSPSSVPARDPLDFRAGLPPTETSLRSSTPR